MGSPEPGGVSIVVLTWAPRVLLRFNTLKAPPESCWPEDPWEVCQSTAPAGTAGAKSREAQRVVVS